jgi:Ca2+-binding RTX toxin-like protein
VTINQGIAQGDDSQYGLYSGASDTDVIRFGTGITASDIVFSFDPNNSSTLTLSVAGTTDAIYLQGWRDEASRQIERFEFSDGAVWTSDTVPVPPILGTDGDDWLTATSGRDVMSGNAGNDYLFGLGGNDIISGDAGDDYLSGGAGNDTLLGGDGNDVRLSGEAGNDTLNAGTGGGVMAGGLGDDIYLFNRGDGDVTIDQRIAAADDPLYDFYAGASDTDVIRFGAGITASDIVTSYISSSATLVLRLKDSEDVLKIPGWHASWDANCTRQIARFEFADGTVWTDDTIPAPPILGADGDDWLSGTTGDDRLDGGAGNDILSGGAGNNNLVGGEGDDTFVADASAGVDHISDTGGVDTLVLQGATLGDISLGIGSLKITVNSTGREIHIDDFDPEDPLGAGGVEYFQFADGSVLDKQQLITTLGFHPTGGEGADSLVGTSLDDSLSGNGGDDSLRGGRGNDTLIGGAGSDRYILDQGAGDDTVIDSTAGNAENRLVFGEGITRDSLSFETEASGLRIRYGATDSVLLQGWSPAGGEEVVHGVEFADGSQESLSSLLNNAPMVASPLVDVATLEGDAFSWTLPDGTFADIDAGDTLSYSATLADGNPLPGWLSFDAQTGSFSGTPTSNAAGLLNLRVTATDLAGASVSDSFNLTVESHNHAPTVTAVMGDQSATQDIAFSYVVPTDSFADSDPGDTLTYSATLANGAALPAWLTFNAATRTFNGTPVAASPGVLAVRVTATDSGGLSAQSDFNLAVGQHLRGTNSSDTMNYSTSTFVGVPLIDGGAGNDTITGTAGNDIIVGGTGTDNLIGSAGNDTFLISGTDAGYDRFEGDAGFDVIQGSTGDDTIRLYNYSAAATVEKIDGNGGNDVIAGTASSDTLDFSGTELVGIAMIDGGAGNDAITGSAGNDVIVGGSGTDRLAGGRGSDTYQLGRGDGSDTIVENDATAGNADLAQFMAGISTDQIWLRHVGNNLEASIIGTADKFTFENWYLGSSYHVEQFKTSDNKVLLDSRVDTLVQAMAAFAPPPMGQTTLQPDYQTALAPVISANWQ